MQIISLVLILIGVLLSGCGSTKTNQQMNVEDYYKKGVEEFKDEDFLEAEKSFNLILLQYSASQYADDAQYYISEINYKRGDYIMAAFNYSRLRRSYPYSEYAKEALFKSALCYNEMSPPFDRDQEYTIKAIQAFSEFQAYYPQDSLSGSANDYIKQLRNKLAYREFFTAELYMKLYIPKSAQIYYDIVIDDYPDTDYYEPAFLGKIQTLVAMKKNREASGLIDLYRNLFPRGKFLDDLNRIEKFIN